MASIEKKISMKALKIMSGAESVKFYFWKCSCLDKPCLKIKASSQFRHCGFSAHP
jgi:hypothetical protein